MTRSRPADRQAGRPRLSTFEAAVALLARRAHATRELERKLAARGHQPAEIEAALTRLAALGHLDDAAFARSLVARRSAGRGRAAIAAELRARGVARAEADAALAELAPEQLRAAAEALAARLLRSGGADAQGAVAVKLLRRGFDFDTALAAVRAAAGDRQALLD